MSRALSRGTSDLMWEMDGSMPLGGSPVEIDRRRFPGVPPRAGRPAAVAAPPASYLGCRGPRPACPAPGPPPRPEAGTGLPTQWQPPRTARGGERQPSGTDGWRACERGPPPPVSELIPDACWPPRGQPADNRGVSGGATGRRHPSECGAKFLLHRKEKGSVSLSTGHIQLRYHTVKSRLFADWK